MKKTIFIIICLVALLVLSSCGNQKYSNIIKLLDEQRYDEAIGEIGKMKEAGYTEEDYEALQIESYVGRTASIRYATRYFPESDSYGGTSFVLDRGYKLDVDFCTFRTEATYDNVRCRFSIQKYNELMDMILNGNPTLFKASVDAEGRYGTEEAKVIELNNTNFENHTIRITVSNFDEIEDFFKTLDHAARYQ